MSPMESILLRWRIKFPEYLVFVQIDSPLFTVFQLRLPEKTIRTHIKLSAGFPKRSFLSTFPSFNPADKASTFPPPLLTHYY